MSTIQHLLLKQSEEFEKRIKPHTAGGRDTEIEAESLGYILSALSTIQQEILQAVKEHVEGMKKSPMKYSNESETPTMIHIHNLALSDLSSWLEGKRNN